MELNDTFRNKEFIDESLKVRFFKKQNSISELCKNLLLLLLVIIIIFLFRNDKDVETFAKSYRLMEHSK